MAPAEREEDRAAFGQAAGSAAAESTAANGAAESAAVDGVTSGRAADGVSADGTAAEPCLVLAGFAEDSIVDGPGLRLTVFCQGCPHRCPGCQNPETWPFAGGTAVPVGEIAVRAAHNPLVRGVTLSGGEPFAQAGPCAALAALLKARGYELAAYTGYTFEELLAGTPEQKALLTALDVLVDGPFIEAECSLELLFRGSKNQRILDVPKSLAAKAAVWSADPRWVGEE